MRYCDQDGSRPQKIWRSQVPWIVGAAAYDRADLHPDAPAHPARPRGGERPLRRVRDRPCAERAQHGSSRKLDFPKSSPYGFVFEDCISLSTLTYCITIVRLQAPVPGTFVSLPTAKGWLGTQVTQEPIMMRLTLLENLCFGSRDYASRERVAAGCTGVVPLFVSGSRSSWLCMFIWDNLVETSTIDGVFVKGNGILDLVVSSHGTIS